MKNIFIGDSLVSIFSARVYKEFRTRKWVSFEQLSLLLNLRRKDETPTKCVHKKSLVYAIKLVRESIINVCGESSIEQIGKKAIKYRYVGEDDNPLQLMYDSVLQKDLKEYFQFCQDSSGLLPYSWLNHFFSRTMDLFEIVKKKDQGKELIISDINRQHVNIDLLPVIYECIKNKKVLQFIYNEAYVSQIIMIFHPHFIKEFNGRWSVFGAKAEYNEYGELLKLEEAYNIPFDRIDNFRH